MKANISVPFSVRIYPTSLFSQDGSTKHKGFVCQSVRFNVKGYGPTRQFAKFDFIRKVKEVLDNIAYT